MNYVNCTPHTIALNDGRAFPATGNVARVASTHTNIEDDCCTVVFGDVTGIPAPVADTMYIVSAMVMSASDRVDIVCPATGHPLTVRENGQVISVPGFVRK